MSCSRYFLWYTKKSDIVEINNQIKNKIFGGFTRELWTLFCNTSWLINCLDCSKVYLQSFRLQKLQRKLSVGISEVRNKIKEWKLEKEVKLSEFDKNEDMYCCLKKKSSKATRTTPANANKKKDEKRQRNL